MEDEKEFASLEKMLHSFYTFMPGKVSRGFDLLRLL